MRSASPVKRTNARSLARPGLAEYQAGRSTRSGSIRSMSITSAAQVALLAAAAEHQHLRRPRLERPAGQLGVGDDPGHLSELGLTLDGPVRAHQHRHRPEPVERRDDREPARAGAHQHPDVLALAHPEREQSADDVVDPALGLGVGVSAVLEEEEVGLRIAPGLLVEQQPERDPGVRAQPPEPGQARELAGDLLGDHLEPADGPRSRSAERAGEPAADPGGESEPDPEPGPDSGLLGRRSSLPDSPHALGQLALAGSPAGPVGDGRPGDLGRGRADHEPEVAGAQRELVDVGPRRGAGDRAHPLGGGDLVDLADDGQDRALDVGQRHRPLADHEAALQHPVVGDELAQEVGQRPAPARRPSPRPSGSAAGARAAAAPRDRAGGARSRPAGEGT